MLLPGNSAPPRSGRAGAVRPSGRQYARARAAPLSISWPEPRIICTPGWGRGTGVRLARGTQFAPWAAAWASRVPLLEGHCLLVRQGHVSVARQRHAALVADLGDRHAPFIVLPGLPDHPLGLGEDEVVRPRRNDHGELPVG